MALPKQLEAHHAESEPRTGQTSQAYFVLKWQVFSLLLLDYFLESPKCRCVCIFPSRASGMELTPVLATTLSRETLSRQTTLPPLLQLDDGIRWDLQMVPSRESRIVGN